MIVVDQPSELLCASQKSLQKLVQIQARNLDYELEDIDSLHCTITDTLEQQILWSGSSSSLRYPQFYPRFVEAVRQKAAIICIYGLGKGNSKSQLLIQWNVLDFRALSLATQQKLQQRNQLIFEMENGLSYTYTPMQTIQSTVPVIAVAADSFRGACTKDQIQGIHQRSARQLQRTMKLNSLKEQCQTRFQTDKLQSSRSGLEIAQQDLQQRQRNLNDLIELVRLKRHSNQTRLGNSHILQPIFQTAFETVYVQELQRKLDLVIARQIQELFMNVYTIQKDTESMLGLSLIPDAALNKRAREQKVQAAYGYVANVTALLGRYLMTPLRYPLNLRLSDATIYNQDDAEYTVSSAEGKDMINKNIELLLDSLNVRILDLEPTILNLSLIQELVGGVGISSSKSDNQLNAGKLK